MICPQRQQQKPNLRICPMHGLLAGVYQGDCSATNAVDQASGLSRECSVLHSKDISVHPSSQSLKHHVGSPDLLPEDPKLNSSCDPSLIRTTSGSLLFLMIWALYNLLPSDPIDTLSFSLQCHLKVIIFYISEERLMGAVTSSIWNADPLMAGFLQQHAAAFSPTTSAPLSLWLENCSATRDFRKVHSGPC